MLRIIICEENKKTQEELHQMIEKCLFDKVEVTIECCENGACFIEQLNNSGKINADLIFLEIQMEEMNGIEIARILRNNQVKADIVFLARHSEYVFRGYEVHAYDYLLKPITGTMIENVLERYLRERKEDVHHYLLVNKRAKKMRIPLNHVRYFVSDKRRIKAIFDKDYGEIDFYMKLDELEEKLQCLGFVRCHQSYIINVHKVLYWERSKIVLLGNEEIAVSRKYVETVKAALNCNESVLI